MPLYRHLGDKSVTLASLLKLRAIILFDQYLRSYITLYLGGNTRVCVCVCVSNLYV